MSTEETSNNFGTFEITSPYFLHASDDPRQLYVEDLLKETNYQQWAKHMRTVLYAKNKIAFVDGSLPMPNPNSSDFHHWKRCDAMVKCWLQMAMQKNIRSSVRYAKSAQEMWQELLERFGKISAHRTYEIHQAISLLQQENLSVTVYYTKLKSYWDEIDSRMALPQCTCSNCKCEVGKQYSSIREKERLYEFLMGLTDVFDVIRSQILISDPLPTVNQAYHRVVTEGKQQQSRPSVELPTFRTTRGQGSS